jgi:hypothetical protein
MRVMQVASALRFIDEGVYEVSIGDDIFDMRLLTEKFEANTFVHGHMEYMDLTALRSLTRQRLFH